MSNLTKDEQKILDLQSPAGQCMVLQDSSSGLLHKVYWNEEDFLAKRFKRKIESETNWFESIITHAPTIGSFYENLLRSTIKEYAPTNNKIGTGFVYDSSRNKHGKQIDVLVFDDSDRSVVYRSDEFVVVNPGSVISAIEVKKTLNPTNLKDVVRSSFYSNLGTSNSRLKNIQNLRIFSYSLSCKKDTIVKALVEVLAECVSSLEISAEDGRSGLLPITYCSLPELYFLDEDFYVTTELVRIEGKHFKVQVIVEKAPGSQSMGRLLDSVVRENPEKILPHEKSYLARPIKPIPDVIDVEGDLYLVDVYSLHELIHEYPESKQKVEALEINGAKPISLHVPKGIKVSGFESVGHFFRDSGTVVEFFKEDGSFMLPGSEVEL
ncbi:hypothetical protein Y5S_03144 [Alcanivorax nanhaiticus]|uniref:DUF6602 domain-containing protein n=1 Tax=Alcanivorax nanhaiticus TaxID=1177154 RepID=A0A095TM33_9GAMM|nr:DUF6602 domain-containing protein [Alcanivorax nanhaiticus]KGD63508.1 hypothetical protein Y5S_03144 [Alcanivorax nanhaiticus]